MDFSAQRKGGKIFWLSFLTFLVWNTSCIYWVFNSFTSAGLPVWIASFISLIPFGLGSLLMAFVFWLYYRFRRVSSKPWSYTALICLWIAYEFLHQSWDLAFPWMTLGNAFASTHQFVQWYEYTGVYGGTLWILISNILVFELYKSVKSSSADKNKLIIATSVVIASPIICSLTIYTNYQEKLNPANVVVVQPNIDPYLKWNSPSFMQVQQLITLSESVAQPNTEYFIWPETGLPDYVDEEKIRSNVNYIQVHDFLNQYKNGNVISGISSYLLYPTPKTPTATFKKEVGKYFDYFNSAVQIENSSKVQFYHKSRLVPGVEKLPFPTLLTFLKPIFESFGGSSGGFGSQEEAGVFYSQSGIGVTPAICYESIWGAYIAESVKKGSQFIAIVTNDGWWGNTSGKDQHMLYAKLRAIETRRWVARSANTGISAFINQRGDLVKSTSWWVPAAIKEDINLNEDLTFYVNNGDFIAFAGTGGAGILLILLITGAVKRKD